MVSHYDWYIFPFTTCSRMGYTFSFTNLTNLNSLQNGITQLSEREYEQRVFATFKIGTNGSIDTCLSLWIIIVSLCR